LEQMLSTPSLAAIVTRPLPRQVILRGMSRYVYDIYDLLWKNCNFTKKKTIITVKMGQVQTHFVWNLENWPMVTSCPYLSHSNCIRWSHVIIDCMSHGESQFHTKFHLI
jgi:hypothetical protein